MSTFLVDNEAMNKFSRENTVWSFHRSRVYDEVLKKGLSLLEREKEYVLRMNELPDDVRRTDDPLYKKNEFEFKPMIQPNTLAITNSNVTAGSMVGITRRMQPPSVFFDDETDLDNYFEGASVSRIAGVTGSENSENAVQNVVPGQATFSRPQENHVRYFFRRNGAGAGQFGQSRIATSATSV
jgi:hypothetical protein